MVVGGGEHIEAFLRAVELFTGLHDEEFKTLSAHAEARAYRDGEVIVRQGEKGGDYVWIVREGTVEVHAHPLHTMEDSGGRPACTEGLRQP